MALVHLEHVTKRFGADRRPATDRLSFTLESGRILALLGPSGCGLPDLVRRWTNHRGVSCAPGVADRAGRVGKRMPPARARTPRPPRRGRARPRRSCAPTRSRADGAHETWRAPPTGADRTPRRARPPPRASARRPIGRGAFPTAPDAGAPPGPARLRTRPRAPPGNTRERARRPPAPRAVRGHRAPGRSATPGRPALPRTSRAAPPARGCRRDCGPARGPAARPGGGAETR